jgi:glycosyltransferase involved in cell wall biosynthesis
MLKVSICIPTYNQVTYLARTLDSILLQTYENYEVIITDDSPDLLVKQFVEQYDFNGKLFYFKNETTLGTPENWNEGVKRATGEYIKIIHHDDWFTSPTSLEQFVNLLADNPECSLAFSSSFVLLANGDNWVHRISPADLIEIQSHPELLLLGNKIGSPSATIYRKNVLEYFDKDLKWLVDIEFYMRVICRFNKLAFAESPLITTYGAEGRVSDHCINREIEVFENFYLFEKIKQLNNHKYWVKINLHLLRLCKKYNISTRTDFAKCGFTGRISSGFLLLLKLF